MSTEFIDGDYSTPIPVGPARPVKPFPDNVVYIWEQDYHVALADFEAEELDTPYSEDSLFYLVEETQPVHIGGGIGLFTRRYAKIPSNRSEYESFAAQLPGLAPGGINIGINTLPTVTNASSQSTITTEVAHGFVMGDFVFVWYTALVDGIFQVTRQIYREVLSVPSSTTFKVKQIVDTDPYVFLAVKASPGRLPVTRVVPSKIVYEYFLPGVSVGIDTPDDIEPFTKTIIVDGSGRDTDTYGYDTVPTQQDYLDLIDENEFVVAEDSTVRRWLGNIHERATRYIRAQ